jgi:transcriptional regulator with XRE-family HTH domain
MKEFGERLKQARSAKGISQEELAKAMNLTQGSISQFEKGLRLPTPLNIERFCEILGIPKENLIGKEEQNSIDVERVRLMRNIKSLPSEEIEMLNKIAEGLRAKGERNKKD